MPNLISSDAIRHPLSYLNTCRKHLSALQITALQTGTQGASSQPRWKPHQGTSIRSGMGLLPPTTSSQNTLSLSAFEADDKQKRNLYPYSIKSSYQVRRYILFCSCTSWAGCWEKPVSISSSSSARGAPMGGQKCFKWWRTHISEGASS